MVVRGKVWSRYVFSTTGSSHNTAGVRYGIGTVNRVKARNTGEYALPALIGVRYHRQSTVMGGSVKVQRMRTTYRGPIVVNNTTW